MHILTIEIIEKPEHHNETDFHVVLAENVLEIFNCFRHFSMVPPRSFQCVHHLHILINVLVDVASD